MADAPSRDFAPGLPRKGEFGDPRLLRAAKAVTFLNQRHRARRAGEHSDIRLGSPDIGLHSWAVPKARMPEPGEKLLAVHQPVHRWGYKDFEGTIEQGYGAGTVTKEREEAATILEAGQSKIKFTLPGDKGPQNFNLIKVGKRNWLLINTTPPANQGDVRAKQKFIKVDPEKVEAFLDWNYSASPKIDGANVLIEMFKDKIEATSHRVSKKTGEPIVHTERLGLQGIKPPPELAGTILTAEAYGTRGAEGKAIPVQELSGLLNSGVEKSLASQKETGTEMRLALHGLRQYKGARPPPENKKRLELIQEIAKGLGEPRVHGMEQAVGPEAARALYERVKSGQHPLTSEGMVFTPLSGGTPRKMPFEDEHDVHIRNIIPAETEGEPRAGAIEYALEPEGPVVGRIGGGWTHELAKDMLANPNDYIGRVARIRSKGQFGSGAHRAPSFLALHEDYPMAKQANDAKREYSCLMLTLPKDCQKKIVSLSAKIADADLYHAPAGEEDKYGRELDPHITIKYGIHSKDPEDVKELLSDAGLVTVTCGKTTLFESDDKPYDVVKIDVESPQLTELNRLVSDNLECTDTHPEYHAHITLAYVKKGLGKKYTGDRRSTERNVLDLEGESAESTELDFSDGDGNHTALRLGGDHVADTGNMVGDTVPLDWNGETLKLRLVDGTEVRNKHYVDFTMAGHGYVYTFVPQDEIWIEKALPPADLLYTLEHELRERTLMRDKGMKYGKAHETVSKIENDERGGKAPLADSELFTKAAARSPDDGPGDQ